MKICYWCYKLKIRFKQLRSSKHVHVCLFLYLFFLANKCHAIIHKFMIGSIAKQCSAINYFYELLFDSDFWHSVPKNVKYVYNYISIYVNISFHFIFSFYFISTQETYISRGCFHLQHELRNTKAFFTKPKMGKTLNNCVN